MGIKLTIEAHGHVTHQLLSFLSYFLPLLHDYFDVLHLKQQLSPLLLQEKVLWHDQFLHYQNQTKHPTVRLQKSKLALK